MNDPLIVSSRYWQVRPGVWGASVLINDQDVHIFDKHLWRDDFFTAQMAKRWGEAAAGILRSLLLLCEGTT